MEAPGPRKSYEEVLRRKSFSSSLDSNFDVVVVGLSEVSRRRWRTGLRLRFYGRGLLTNRYGR